MFAKPHQAQESLVAPTIHSAFLGRGFDNEHPVLRESCLSSPPHLSLHPISSIPLYFASFYPLSTLFLLHHYFQHQMHHRKSLQDCLKKTHLSTKNPLNFASGKLSASSHYFHTLSVTFASQKQKRFNSREQSNQPHQSKLRFLQSKQSFLEYDDPRHLDQQHVKFISGGVAIAVREMKPFVRQGDTNALLRIYEELQRKFPEWAIRDHWMQLHIHILQGFVRNRDIDAADAWFKDHFDSSYSPNPGMPTSRHWAHYNTLMMGYANEGNVRAVNELAKHCFIDSPDSRRSVELNTTVLKAHTESGNVEEAERFFYSTFRSSIRPTWMNRVYVDRSIEVMPSIHTYCLMLSFYGKYGFVDRAKEVFEAAVRDIPQLASKSVELHNAMMEAYALSAGEYEMMSVFSGVFRSTLTAQTRTHRLLPSTFTYIIMMEYYLKKGDPKSVIFLFNLMMNDKKLFNNNDILPQPKLYFLLIDAFLETENIDQAITTLYYRNILYPADVFLKVIAYLANHGLVDQMRGVVRHMQNRFDVLPNETIQYLVSAYCKTDIEGALHIFQESFNSPVERERMELRGIGGVDSLDPAAGITSSLPVKIADEKLEPSADLLGELLWSMAKHNLPHLLYLWIDEIHRQSIMPLDVDLMNYLLLTMLQEGHVESAGEFALRYFTEYGRSNSDASRLLIEGNDRTVEILREGDILVHVEGKMREMDSIEQQ